MAWIDHRRAEPGVAVHRGSRAHDRVGQPEVTGSQLDQVVDGARTHGHTERSGLAEPFAVYGDDLCSLFGSDGPSEAQARATRRLERRHAARGARGRARRIGQHI